MQQIFKKCSRCGHSHPPTAEYFPKAGNRSEDGLKGWCKDCASTYNQEYHKAHPHKRKAEMTPEEWEAHLAERRDYYHRKKHVIKASVVKLSQKDPVVSRARRMLRTMKTHASTINVPFDAGFFTLDRVSQMISESENCPCCGAKLNIGFEFSGKVNNATATVDRIDSSRGYEAGNVAIICWRCNSIKRDATVAELEGILRYMQSH